MISLFPVYGLSTFALWHGPVSRSALSPSDTIRKLPERVNGHQYTISAFLYTFPGTVGRLAPTSWPSNCTEADENRRLGILCLVRGMPPDSMVGGRPWPLHRRKAPRWKNRAEPHCRNRPSTSSGRACLRPRSRRPSSSRPLRWSRGQERRKNRSPKQLEQDGSGSSSTFPGSTSATGRWVLSPQPDTINPQHCSKTGRNVYGKAENVYRSVLTF